ncbi:hypothetical protein ABN080_12555 [Proteus sp. fly-1089]|uniref:hypothetical protein n=1 Tax=Proteus sp. fly-1089 TaxID=3136675 RepID=UPI0032DAF0A2
MFIGCTNLKYKITHESDKNQCELSRYFLNKTLILEPNHGVALFYQAAVFENGYGVEKDIPQDLNKAKEYAKWTAENGSKEYQEYIKKWDYILFSLELKTKLKECKRSGVDASICIRRSNNALMEYANKMYPME